MKIKLAILHSDISYLQRLSSALEMKYGDKLSLYSFTDLAIALSALPKERIDVFLADDSFKIEPAQLPPKCGFAYFVDSPEMDTVNGCKAICKFQRTELMYKQILGVFSEALGDLSIRNVYSESTKVIIFSSPCGGTGTSTLAAACSAHFAGIGKRSLYLNFERFGEADIYFSAEGTANMSDVVYAAKSGRGNLPIKLESCVKQDNCGVYYFSAAKVALDIMELTAEEKKKLISALIYSNHYDYIIIDMDFDLEKQTLSLFHQAHMLVWVSDGLLSSNRKIARAYAALSVLEQNEQNPLSERVCTIQNKYSSTLGDTVSGLELRSAGLVPKIRHKVDERIIVPISASGTFDAILMG